LQQLPAWRLLPRHRLAHNPARGPGSQPLDMFVQPEV
jgi:hypothetical protein